MTVTLDIDQLLTRAQIGAALLAIAFSIYLYFLKLPSKKLTRPAAKK